MLTIVGLGQLFPRVSSRWLVGPTVLVCAILIVATLVQVRRDALERIAINTIGAKLVQAGPSCANVSSMWVRAPEHAMNFGADTTFSNPKMEEQFSEVYQRAFKAPLLDHGSYYRGELRKNFPRYSYPRLAAEYPCIVVRTYSPVIAATSLGLLELNPDHCVIGGINVYAVGIACEKIRNVYAELNFIPDTLLFR